MNKMEDLFRFADEFGPSRIIHIHYARPELKAIVVIDNTLVVRRSVASDWRPTFPSKNAFAWRGR